MFITELSFTQQEAVHGWVAFAGKHGEGFAREGAMFSHFNPADIAGVACASQGSTSNFKVLVMEAPAMESTSRVPNAPLRVVSDKGEISTAGVIATRAGDLGVTAALHAVQDSTGRGPTVDGNTAKVVSQDVLSDSAFLVPSDTGLLAGPAATPLSGLVPRMFEDVSFSGVISGHTKGQIRGVDPRLPFVSSKAQLVVTTDLITAKGDSGAALVDTSGNVLGFAHERSLASARNPYSSWIWADLVFAVHGLT
jgi:hypothetical protein